MRTITSTFMAVSTAQSTEASPTASQRSPWHSPVPYLFGGLAAMLGLIAFALLILACSYWRLTGREEDRRRRDLERGGDSEKDDSSELGEKSSKVYDEKILVIMAGDQKPTFLATPVFAKLVSLGFNGEENNTNNGESGVNGVKDGTSSDEKVDKEVMSIDVDDQHNDDDAQSWR